MDSLTSDSSSFSLDSLRWNSSSSDWNSYPGSSTSDSSTSDSSTWDSSTSDSSINSSLIIPPTPDPELPRQQGQAEVKIVPGHMPILVPVNGELPGRSPSPANGELPAGPNTSPANAGDNVANVANENDRDIQCGK